jgi:hypothetical protein
MVAIMNMVTILDIVFSKLNVKVVKLIYILNI